MAAYAVVAWLLMQAADVVFPSLNLPPWTVTFAVVMLILGFPVTAFLAWAYDLTPEGIRLTPNVDYDSVESDAPAGDTDEAHKRIGPPDMASALAAVAVLPFENLIPEGRYAPLADAMTIELHALLSRVPEIRVVPRQSSAALSGSGSLKVIADELDVRYVISGSVAEFDGQIHVTADLNDAVDDTQLWSEQYEVTIEDVWHTQRRIVESIVSTFGGERLRADIRRAVSAPPANMNAWQLVQRARGYVLDYRAETLLEAVPLLERAVALDAGYATAHAAFGLVKAEMTLNGLSDRADEERRSALESVQRAEQLSPRDPAVLRAAGCVYAYTGDYRRSNDVLRRAVKLAPYDLGTWGYMGWPLVASGSRAALDELNGILDHLLESAPKHPGRAYWLFHKAVALGCVDESEPALEFAQECTAEQPYFSLGWMHRASLLGRLGRHAEARDAAHEAVSANARMTPQHYAGLMAVLSDQAPVIERRVAGLYAAGLCTR